MTRDEMQEVVEALLELYPAPFTPEVDVTAEMVNPDHIGEFAVESWEMDDGSKRDYGMIRIHTFEEWSREELIEALQLQMLVHEAAHAIQWRSEAFEDEREQDHDADFGIAFARAYNFIMSRPAAMPAKDAFEILGIDADLRESLIEALAEKMGAVNGSEADSE